MRFRNFVSAVAIFLSGGVAFVVAEEPADEDARRETTYTVINPTSAAESQNIFVRYFHDTTGDNSLTITSLRYTPVSETVSGWIRFAPEDEMDDADAADGARPHSADGASSTRSGSEGEPADAAPSNMDRLAEASRVYELTSPFDDSITETISLAGAGDYERGLDRSNTSADGSADSLFSDNGTYPILAFKKKAFLDSQNSMQILFGGYYANDFEEESFARSPLALPFSMLSFALGVSIIVVLHTSAGKAHTGNNN